MPDDIAKPDSRAGGGSRDDANCASSIRLALFAGLSAGLMIGATIGLWRAPGLAPTRLAGFDMNLEPGARTGLAAAPAAYRTCRAPRAPENFIFAIWNDRVLGPDWGRPEMAMRPIAPTKAAAIPRQIPMEALPEAPAMSLDFGWRDYPGMLLRKGPETGILESRIDMPGFQLLIQADADALADAPGKETPLDSDAASRPSASSRRTEITVARTDAIAALAETDADRYIVKIDTYDQDVRDRETELDGLARELARAEITIRGRAISGEIHDAEIHDALREKERALERAIREQTRALREAARARARALRDIARDRKDALRGADARRLDAIAKAMEILEESREDLEDALEDARDEREEALEDLRSELEDARREFKALQRKRAHIVRIANATPFTPPAPHQDGWARETETAGKGRFSVGIGLGKAKLKFDFSRRRKSARDAAADLPQLILSRSLRAAAAPTTPEPPNRFSPLGALRAAAKWFGLDIGFTDRPPAPARGPSPDPDRI